MNKFTFNIRSLFHVFDPTDLLSNEDIRNSLIGLQMNEILSYVDYSVNQRDGQCHMFSYPYTLEYVDDLTNRFPNGLFECVREVRLFDERPFEHEFFLRLAQAFPALEILSLSNEAAQEQKLISNDQGLAKIEYPHLTELVFNCTHDDYIEQFLMAEKTVLSNPIYLSIDYEPLKTITRNFRRIATQINCAKVNHLRLWGRSQTSEGLTEYFPLCDNDNFLNLFK